MAELRKEDLWVMADKLRNNMDSAEYKHVCLGLIFLKYISDSFERARLNLLKDEYADLEDKDEYVALNVFWVPEEARWENIKSKAKDPTIGQVIDNAMYSIEKENASLRGVLPKDFARASLDKRSLGELVDLLWDVRESVRAQMRITIKRLLRKYKYPPDKQADAVDLIIEQAEKMCEETLT